MTEDDPNVNLLPSSSLPPFSPSVASSAAQNRSEIKIPPSAPRLFTPSSTSFPLQQQLLPSNEQPHKFAIFPFSPLSKAELRSLETKAEKERGGQDHPLNQGLHADQAKHAGSGAGPPEAELQGKADMMNVGEVIVQHHVEGDDDAEEDELEVVVEILVDSPSLEQEDANGGDALLADDRSPLNGFSRSDSVVEQQSLSQTGSSRVDPLQSSLVSSISCPRADSATPDLPARRDAIKLSAFTRSSSLPISLVLSRLDALAAEDIGQDENEAYTQYLPPQLPSLQNRVGSPAFQEELDDEPRSSRDTNDIETLSRDQSMQSGSSSPPRRQRGGEAALLLGDEHWLASPGPSSPKELDASEIGGSQAQIAEEDEDKEVRQDEKEEDAIMEEGNEEGVEPATSTRALEPVSSFSRPKVGRFSIEVAAPLFFVGSKRKDSFSPSPASHPNALAPSLPPAKRPKQAFRSPMIFSSPGRPSLPVQAAESASIESAPVRLSSSSPPPSPPRIAPPKPKRPKSTFKALTVSIPPPTPPPPPKSLVSSTKKEVLVAEPVVKRKKLVVVPFQSPVGGSSSGGADAGAFSKAREIAEVEKKVQLLKQALRFVGTAEGRRKEERDKELVGKWKVVGREIAELLWGETPSSRDPSTDPPAAAASSFSDSPFGFSSTSSTNSNPFHSSFDPSEQSFESSFGFASFLPPSEDSDVPPTDDSPLPSPRTVSMQIDATLGSRANGGRVGLGENVRAYLEERRGRRGGAGGEDEEDEDEVGEEGEEGDEETMKRKRKESWHVGEMCRRRFGVDPVLFGWDDDVEDWM